MGCAIRCAPRRSGLSEHPSALLRGSVTLGTVRCMPRAAVLFTITALAASLSGCDSPPPPPPGDAASASVSAPAPSATPPPAEQPRPATPTAATDDAAPEVVAAQHVLVAYTGAKRAPKTVTRSKADAKKRAEEALAKARKGDDFSQLVKAYSDEPGAAERLGNLGKFKREAMVKPFADAAFALKVGDVSDVVETEFGFHVIKRNQ